MAIQQLHWTPWKRWSTGSFQSSKIRRPERPLSGRMNLGEMMLQSWTFQEQTKRTNSKIRQSGGWMFSRWHCDNLNANFSGSGWTKLIYEPVEKCFHQSTEKSKNKASEIKSWHFIKAKKCSNWGRNSVEPNIKIWTNGIFRWVFPGLEAISVEQKVSRLPVIECFITVINVVE